MNARHAGNSCYRLDTSSGKVYCMTLMYPARSLARHTAAVMEFLRQPFEGLRDFDDTISGLTAARGNLAMIQEMNGSIEAFENVVEKVDHALTMIMAYDGSGEQMTADAQGAYDDAEYALSALEQRVGIKVTHVSDISNKPNWLDAEMLTSTPTAATGA